MCGTDDDFEGRLSTEPTERHLANAYAFLDFHVRQRRPGGAICAWCHRHWPCLIVRWSRRVVLRAQRCPAPMPDE